MCKLFGDPLTEVYLLFFQVMLPTMINANKFLQRDELLMHMIKFYLTHFIKNTMSKSANPCQVAQDNTQQKRQFSIQQISIHGDFSTEVLKQKLLRQYPNIYLQNIYVKVWHQLLLNHILTSYIFLWIAWLFLGLFLIFICCDNDIFTWHIDLFH